MPRRRESVTDARGAHTPMKRCANRSVFLSFVCLSLFKECVNACVIRFMIRGCVRACARVRACVYNAADVHISTSFKLNYHRYLYEHVF